jgi:CheY-like chemotaxis protein
VTPPSIILYAEDERDDIFFLESAFQIAGLPLVLKSVPDGEQAIHYLAGEGAFADRSRHPLPALILLDINIPKKNGFDVLKWIRQQPDLKSLPVLIFTSSTREEDRDNARQFGADDYLLKPADPLKLTELVRTFHDRCLASPSPTPASATV